MKNLQPGQQITLNCDTIERNTLFTSHAHFMANLSGEVDTRVDPSFGGSYNGVSQMGIFWSMTPRGNDGRLKAIRYIPDDVVQPRKFTLKVFFGFLHYSMFACSTVESH